MGGEALPNKKDRDYFVLTTKFSLRARGENAVDPNTDGNSRKNLIRSVESSLERLNTNYFDLLYPHMWDYTTPVKQLEHNAGVLYFELSPDQLDQISEFIKFPTRYRRVFLHEAYVLELLRGKTYPFVDIQG